MQADDPDRAWTFDSDVRVYCVDESDLVIYDSELDTAWLGMQSALHLRDWR